MITFRILNNLITLRGYHFLDGMFPSVWFIHYSVISLYLLKKLQGGQIRKFKRKKKKKERKFHDLDSNSLDLEKDVLP